MCYALHNSTCVQKTKEKVSLYDYSAALSLESLSQMGFDVQILVSDLEYLKERRIPYRPAHAGPVDYLRTIWVLTPTGTVLESHSE